MRPDADHVLLSVDLDALDQAKLGPDNYELQDWLDGLDDIARDGIGGISQWDEATWQQSLAWCNQVAYGDRIRPEAICVVGSIPTSVRRERAVE